MKSPFKTDSDLQAYLQRARNGFRPYPAETGSGTNRPGPPALIPEREYDNKWEAAYAVNLELQKKAGIIADWKYHCLKIRLAKRTWYWIDFLVIPVTGVRVEIHEVKGFMRDDANVKIKTVAEMFPFFRFMLATKEGDGWNLKEVCR